MTTLGYMTKEQAIEKVTEIMKTYDTNKSGEIDYSEFIIATLNKEKFLNAKNVKTAFQMFDIDHDGYIDKFEFMNIMAFKSIERNIF